MAKTTTQPNWRTPVKWTVRVSNGGGETVFEGQSEDAATAAADAARVRRSFTDANKPPVTAKAAPVAAPGGDRGKITPVDTK